MKTYIRPDILRRLAALALSAGALDGVAAGASATTAANPYYVFGIGSGISSADLSYVMVDGRYGGGEGYFLGPSRIPGNQYFQATYSSRFQGYPENLWIQSSPWLTNGDLDDNEQSELHWIVNTSTQDSVQCGAHRRWYVRVEYEVSSEANYDWLWINSTGSTCGDSGVVQKRVSGNQSGAVSFELPANCPNAWVGVYYIKDYSLSAGTDQGKVKNITMYPQFSSCVCQRPPGTGCADVR